MKKLATVSAILLVSGVAASTAAAQMHHPRGHGEGPHHRFEGADADGDGNITLEELQGARESRFAGMDADGDGNVTLEEYVAAEQARRAERMAMRQQHRFSMMDTDGDGVITPEEHAAHGGDRMMKMFDRVDSNDDGVISQAERDAVRGSRMGGDRMHRADDK